MSHDYHYWSLAEGYSKYEDKSADSDWIPKTSAPLYLLGRSYSALHDTEDIQSNVQSKLWITYRKNFAPIGGIGPTSDSGWGCMLRCGQMVMAQALITRHLGRDWRWSSGCSNPKYRRILKLFFDKKDSLYSIHQIAQMGVAEGKTVGQWFGPNTIAQVLKKLSIYDKWSSIKIHVALDNAVITDDIIHLCTSEPKPDSFSSSTPSKRMSESTDSSGFTIPETYSEINSTATKSYTNQHQNVKSNAESESNSDHNSLPNISNDSAVGTSNLQPIPWKPLLLFIPLRLGLAEINPIYVNGLKKFLKLKQSIGIIGGKPNHALYFIGYAGDELIYLDPHTTQPVCTCFDDECERHLSEIDRSYHCNAAQRMNILNVDPSLALCSFCESEAEFQEMCSTVKKFLIDSESQPLFELSKERPPHWPSLVSEASIDPEINTDDWNANSSDEEFVLLG